MNLLYLMQVINNLPKEVKDYSAFNFIAGGAALIMLIGFVTLVLKTLWNALQKMLSEVMPIIKEIERRIGEIHNFVSSTPEKLTSFANDHDSIESSMSELDKYLKDSNRTIIEKIDRLIEELRNIKSEIKVK